MLGNVFNLEYVEFFFTIQKYVGIQSEKSMGIQLEC